MKQQTSGPLVCGPGACVRSTAASFWFGRVFKRKQVYSDYTTVLTGADIMVRPVVGTLAPDAARVSSGLKTSSYWTSPTEGRFRTSVNDEFQHLTPFTSSANVLEAVSLCWAPRRTTEANGND